MTEKEIFTKFYIRKGMLRKTAEVCKVGVTREIILPELLLATDILLNTLYKNALIYL